jgi:hypothetical protein
MSSSIYNQIAKELGLEYAKKGTPEYQRIMDVKNARYPPKQLTDTEKLWNKCCEYLGYKYVKKGTREYDLVKNRFRQELDKTKNRSSE